MGDKSKQFKRLVTLETALVETCDELRVARCALEWLLDRVGTAENEEEAQTIHGVMMIIDDRVEACDEALNG